VKKNHRFSVMSLLLSIALAFTVFMPVSANEINSVTLANVEIEDVISIAEAHAQKEGNVKVQGIVTAKLKNTIHIQDETGGIAVRPVNLDVEIGDLVVLKGRLNNYRTLLQVDSSTIVSVEKAESFPDPINLSVKDIDYKYQSMFASLSNLKITKANVDKNGNWANYTAVDVDGNEIMIRDESNTLNLEKGQSYDVISGIISHFDGNAQILPRSNADIIKDEGKVQPVYATPTLTTLPEGSRIELKTDTEGADIYFSLDGKNPLEDGVLYKESIVLSNDITIKAVATKEGLEPSDLFEISYEVIEIEDQLKIHDIQGEGHTSPLEGQEVEFVEGIVTYIYDIYGNYYFHLQADEKDYDDNPKTSEALIVCTNKKPEVEVGHRVLVSGVVAETAIDGYAGREETDLTVTNIDTTVKNGHISVLETEVELPKPIKIKSSDIPEVIASENVFEDFEPENYAIDFWESLEGMRVEIQESKAVAPQEHGDIVVVTQEYETNTINGGILLDESGSNAQMISFKLYPNQQARNFAVKTGDYIQDKIVGVVNYGYSNYKVYAELADVQAAFVEGETTPQVSKIEHNEDKLTIASYNVENFSANRSNRETPDEKAENIARAFVQDMDSPDIIGLIEVQDNNGQEEGPEDADASESLQRLIDAIVDKGGPEYASVNINPIYNQDGGAPHGNIRVAYLYNPKRVSLVEAEHGTAEGAVGYENGKLTMNPGRINPTHPAFESSRKSLAAQFEFKGESVVVIANHLNSKIGDTPAFGKVQPPLLVSQSQRIEMAKVIAGFVNDIKQDNPDENIIVLGDMNDFQFSKALSVLEGEHLENMINHVPENERYTYVYQGHSQVLDHVLVSNNIVSKAVIDVVHVNADFTEMHGRASDHDPVLLQLDLLKKDEETPGETTPPSETPGGITPPSETTPPSDVGQLPTTGESVIKFVGAWSMILFGAYVLKKREE